MKTLVLTEKPSVGKEIGRILKCNKRTKTNCEGNNYIVTWAMGHLIELADPGSYHEEWKNWVLGSLPMLPEKMKLKVIRKTSHQFNSIKYLFHRKDVNKLIIATDAGREGELVARWIIRLGGWKGPIQRLWISSQTDKAITTGFSNLKPGKEYETLFHAAEARAEADWIVGLNVTRALSCKFDARLSAGRVQTPTLAILEHRKKEIKNFKPQAYWTINGDFNEFEGLWKNDKGQSRIFNQLAAQKLEEKVKGKTGIIRDIIIKEKKDYPPQAYDLTELQRDANRRLGFSAKKTLQVLQGLYERHKYATYPRTDSRYISADIVPTLKSRLKALSKTQFQQAAVSLINKEINPGRHFVDDKKVTDHHAIIPTEENVNLDRLNAEEKALWQLIAQRFIAVLYPPYRYKQITIITDVNGECFYTKGIEVIDKGWKIIGGVSETIEEDEEPLQQLKSNKKGEKRNLVDVKIKQSHTLPPGHYTEATLLTAMEHPGKFISNQQLKQSIAQGGLGTSATRADIIEKLISNYYIERQNRSLIPTGKGSELLDVVPEELKLPDLTAKWEIRLTQIVKGTEKPQNFSADIRKNTKELVDRIKNSSTTYQPRNLSKKQCPVCSRKMMNARDKKGNKILVCPSRACGYEESERTINNPNRKATPRERRMNQQLINQFSDKSKDTATFADLINAAKERKQKKE